MTSAEDITRLLERARRIAVIGIKTPESGQPAYGVPAYVQQAGYEIIPVPVYYPDVTELLGAPVHRSLATVAPPIDIVQLFRRPDDVPKHLDELLAARPAAVWMQLGIRHEQVAEALARAGIDVVQDHCMKIELMARGR
ncbi:MAG: CoA-binding protein [Gemmatimonadaceae bacterium]|nr:CoA-binding protein [Gemmatimonadaceae bacterium]